MTALHILRRFGGAMIVLSLVTGCNSVSRRSTAVLSGTDTTISFEIWPQGLTGFDAKVRVANPRGEAITTLWEDIDLPGRPNLYRTPEGYVAVISGLGEALFAIPRDGAPRLLTRSELPHPEASSKWTYLGAMYQTGSGPTRFVPAARLPECIALYGEGSVRYRKKFSVEHSCSSSHPAKPLFKALS